jgi:membrane protein
MVYWSMLTVVPLLVGVSVFLSSYLISLPLFSEVDSSARQSLISTLPFTTSAIAFTLFYMLIPNRKVVWRHALIGGVIAAILFGLAKYGFAIYVTHSDVYETVYGTLSTIPLFLIWIYVSWIIVLLGAEITYCLGAFRWREDTVKHDQSNELLVAYRLLGHLWVAQCEGKTIQMEQLLAWESNGDEDKCLAILDRLRQATWIYRTPDGGQWGLARDLGEISLLDFYQLMGQQVFLQPKTEDMWNCNLAPILAQVCLQAEAVMDIPLKQLYKREIEHADEKPQQTVQSFNPKKVS